MRFYISGKPESIDSVGFYEVGFGAAPCVDFKNFTLEVPIGEFRSAFEPIYTDCVSELKRDDELTGEFVPPYVGATSYPSFDDFIELPTQARMEMVRVYFIFDLLRLFFRELDGESNLKWTVKSLNSIAQKGDFIILEGLVF